MKSVVYDKEYQRVPVKIWAPLIEVEEHAVDQLRNISSLPFVFKHVAAMPDVHLGKGATVGSVLALKNAVIPAAVGVDIGCGMMALRLDIEPGLVLDKTHQIRASIERSIPVGFHKNKSASNSVQEWSGWKTVDDLNATKIHSRGATSLISNAALQMGTLGGGNHFIELCQDTNGAIWVMLHSGSRNIGKSLAEIHIANAKELMKRMFITLPDPDLAYYVSQTKEYDQYMYDLSWAQDYAARNRQEMMALIMKDISYAVGLGGAQIQTSMVVNCHHNYAEMENHYGENVLITRKGAVRARCGDLGIIPGSMGTKSYIVEGLGNEESFNSCSHGAGRRMSRTAARKAFTIEDLATQTMGVDCRKDDGVLDEIPGSYKDIDQVMENQKDLVKVIAQLKQFICIKG